MTSSGRLRVDTCWAPKSESLALRTPAAVRSLVVHRIEVSQEDPRFRDTPEDVARFFREHPLGVQATGGNMPYPVLIDGSGRITQTVPLGRITPHAKSHNPHSIGIGLLGDFRCQVPSKAQYASLVQLLGSLAAELGLPPECIRGHDELLGGSADPNKECPGCHLPMAKLRDDVASGRAHSEHIELVW